MDLQINSQETKDTPELEQEFEDSMACRCGSTLPTIVSCTGCDDAFCRKCLLEHDCICGNHEAEPLTLYCAGCKQMLCARCLPGHGCFCKKEECKKISARIGPCFDCGLFFCENCGKNHVCPCDCGSGLPGIQCGRCGHLYCTMCVGSRHVCMCEKCKSEPGTVVCTSMGAEFLCAACFRAHACGCRCPTQAMDLALQEKPVPRGYKWDRRKVGLTHCRICGAAFCEKCVDDDSHKCHCGYCGESQSHRYCGLCQGLFCAYCIDSHPCACENPGCPDRRYPHWSMRRFCFGCLRLFCYDCYSAHLKRSECPFSRCECERRDPVRYRCACGALLCENCIYMHECPTLYARRVLTEKYETLGMDSIDKIEQECKQDECCFTARIGTWNMNHLAKNTRKGKLDSKKDAMSNVCLGAGLPLDVLALQEINATAVQHLEGLSGGVEVLNWGPLLQSESVMSRLEFVRSFPSMFVEQSSGESKQPDKKRRRRSSGKNQALNEAKIEFYKELDGSEDLSREYDGWVKAVNLNTKHLGSKAKMSEYREAELQLQKEFKSGEALYEKHRPKRYRYQEYYPLIGVKSDQLTVDPLSQIYYGEPTSCRVIDNVEPKQPVVFRGGDVESEFRPVVVYTLTKKCARQGCTGLKFKLGVVHTSPEMGTSEFDRYKIYQHQLKTFLTQMVAEGGLWVVVGDYYLTAETVVFYGGGRRKPKGINQNRNVPDLKLNFERQIPEALEIVASVSATNHPTWRAKFEPFDSVRAQVADFGICSRAWPLKRAFPIDPETGKTLAVDMNSRAFQAMRRNDTSDHSPVLVYIAKDARTAKVEINQMLGYSEKFIEVTTAKMKGWALFREETRTERIAMLEKECAGLRVEIEKMGMGSGAYLTLVKLYRSRLQRLLSMRLPSSDLTTFDFQPTTLCSEGMMDFEI